MSQTSSVDGAEKVKGRYEKLRNEEVYALLFHNQGNEKTYIIVFYIKKKVVKLFNAIQQTQAAAAAEAEETKAQRGSGKPTLPAPKFEGKGKKKKAGPPPSTKAESSTCMASLVGSYILFNVSLIIT